MSRYTEIRSEAHATTLTIGTSAVPDYITFIRIQHDGGKELSTPLTKKQAQLIIGQLQIFVGEHS